MKKGLIPTSFHYHQRLSCSKLCFMSTMSLSSCHLSKSNYTPHRECRAGPLFYFAAASLPLKCELKHHRPPRPLPSLCCFHSPCFIPFFLSTSYCIYCSLPDTLFSLSLTPLKLTSFTISPPEVVALGCQIPGIPGSGLMTAKGS